ncbi:hypothetical protein [Streptosporangium sp. NPDC049046]|uniref:hypothetical protein n=1 Tax=Streptosporangium sp. NPDC049046 TaxID=3155031 RepID=UPI00342E2DBE
MVRAFSEGAVSENGTVKTNDAATTNNLVFRDPLHELQIFNTPEIACKPPVKASQVRRTNAETPEPPPFYAADPSMRSGLRADVTITRCSG